MPGQNTAVQSLVIEAFSPEAFGGSPVPLVPPKRLGRALVGENSPPRTSEISLADHGALNLDEFEDMKERDCL